MESISRRDIDQAERYMRSHLDQVLIDLEEMTVQKDS
jgi:DNA-binding FadR family transcriptional regulator